MRYWSKCIEYPLENIQCGELASEERKEVGEPIAGTAWEKRSTKCTRAGEGQTSMRRRWRRGERTECGAQLVPLARLEQIALVEHQVDARGRWSCMWWSVWRGVWGRRGPGRSSRIVRQWRESRGAGAVDIFASGNQQAHKRTQLIEQRAAAFATAEQLSAVHH